ncbi:hypothetical protein T439DRAFT_314824 [Meredithblackwellia eburnea MCA 4105]
MASWLQLSRLQTYGLVSTSIFVYTIVHAFRQRSNFYSAAVYLSKSNACMMILWNQGIYQTVLFGKLLQTVFFGELRMIEVERLQERGWFAITETLLALTIFKDEFDSSFVLLFVSLLFLKVFHWLAADRVELMEQSANIPRLFHLRMGALLSMLWAVDILLLIFAVESILIEGPTVMIMFASEYMILLAMVWSTTMKYGLNVADLRSEVPWEEKSIYVFYVDLATDFFKLITYVSFFGLILTFYGLPLNILRDVYLTFRSFILKCRDLRRYRQATRNMDSLYPNASADEMERMTDKTCIICREDMEYRGPQPAGEDGAQEAAPAPPPPPPAGGARAGPNDTPKKLPCGHVFHFHCLRSWLERQQSCPTCRRPVLPSEQARAAPPPPPPVPRAVPPAGEDVVRQAQVNLARNLGREAFAVVFPGIPFPPEAGGAVHPPPANDAPTPVLPREGGIAPPTTPAGGLNVPPVNDSGVGSSTVLPPLPATAAQGAGPGHDNPLARFSLPNHRLPPAGEASLYGSQSNGSTSSGVSYGGYPSGSSGRSSFGMNGLGPTRVPNLEERLIHIRQRMAQAAQHVASSSSTVHSNGQPSPTPSTSSQSHTHVTPPPLVAVEVPLSTPVASSTTPENGVPPSTPSQGEVQETSNENPARTARMAALEAAERRARLARDSKGGPALIALKPTPAATVLNQDFLPGVVEKEDVTKVESPANPVEAATTNGTSTEDHVQASNSENSVPPLSSSSNPTYPRLIPLFSSEGPLPTSQYPHLLSTLPPSLTRPYTPGSSPRNIPSRPLIPQSPTPEQLKELSQLTRSAIEERLRQVVAFQDRLSALASDMSQVLHVLPSENIASNEANRSTEVATSEMNAEARRAEKGKQPVEGIHAVPVVNGS